MQGGLLYVHWLDHPPHVPYLGPSECHLFPKPQEHLRGHDFLSDDEVKSAAKFFQQQDILFYGDSLKTAEKSGESV